MAEGGWLTAVAAFAIESTLESAIVYAVVAAVLQTRRALSPALRARFLMLPLTIPVLVSPTIHLLFPGLRETALVAHLDGRLRLLDRSHDIVVALAPLLIGLFLALLILNLLHWAAVALREVTLAQRLSSAPTHRLSGVLRSLSASIGTRAPGLYLTSRPHVSAYLLGWRIPVIVLGQPWASALDAEEMEAVLAHELAHLRRGDRFGYLIAKVCRDLMFFNPLAHHVYRRLRLAIEEAADDLAITHTHKPLALASSLLKCLRMLHPTVMPHATAFLPAPSGGFEQRIARLAKWEPASAGSGSTTRLFYAVYLTLTVALSLV